MEALKAKEEKALKYAAEQKKLKVKEIKEAGEKLNELLHSKKATVESMRKEIDYKNRQRQAQQEK
jgi:predicted Zn-dependent protease